MENESTSTWAFLDKSGEIVNVPESADLGSSPESSIEFILDETVHYERNDNDKSGLEREIQKDTQDVVENSSEVLDFNGAVSEGATAAADNAVKEENGEKRRGEFILENISSINCNAPVSPNSTSPVSPNSTSPVSPDSTSPVSPSSSDDSSGSVTLLEGRFSDGDSDFELLDQHSSSDLAHLQLAAGVGNALPAAHRPKFNFKFKKQALGTSETESVNASDADDESSNNVELCSSPEESEIAPAALVDEIPPVTNMGSLTPVSPHLPVPTLVHKQPRMSVTFMILASLAIGLLLGLSTKYSLGPYSSEQLSEDIDEMQRINEILLLREENEHMRKYVDSLKWRMNNLQNSNKQQLLDELQRVNQLLKGRLDELREQLDIMDVQREILVEKSGVQPPIVSDAKHQDLLPADVLQDLNEPASDNHPESQTAISNPVSAAASHDDIIQIHSSTEELAPEELAPEDLAPEELAPEELAPEDLAPEDLAPEDLAPEELAPEELTPEENLEVSYNQGSTDQMSASGVSLLDIPQNDASIGSDEIIKSENKADDTILQKKLKEEKRRADNLEKLYVELKQLVDNGKPTTESSIETVQGDKAKKAQESASYCSPLDKDCRVGMDWLNQDAMLHLITSVISEIPPQAQQWKEYMAKKFQSILDPHDHVEPDEELKDEPETNTNFQFKKLNSYMNRMLDQMNKAKQDLQMKFEKTLHKIKRGTNQFLEKAASKNPKEKKFKKSKERKKEQELVDIRDIEAKHRSPEDSSLQLTEENNDFDTEKGLEVVEIEQNKHKFDDKKIKSFRSNEGKGRQQHRSGDSKKHRPQKSNHKEKKQRSLNPKNEDKKHQHKFKDDKEQKSDKSDNKEKKHRSHKSDNKEKKLRSHKSDNKEKKLRSHKSDNKEKKLHSHKSDNKEKELHSHKSDSEDKKRRSHKSDSEDKKRRSHKSDNKEKKHRTHKSDSEDTKPQHRFNDNKENRPHKSDDKEKEHRYKYDDDNEKHQPAMFDDDDDDDDIKHQSHKSDHDKKHSPHKSDKKYQTEDSEDDEYDDDDDDYDDGMNKQVYKSAKNKNDWSHRSADEKRKYFRKQKAQDNDEEIIDKSFSHEKSASHKRKAKEYSDNKKSQKSKKKSKNDPEMKAQSKDSCDQLAVNLEDSISTISKEKFRRMKSHTILRISIKLSSFNKQCKHFSSRSMKEWSACQQMWWTLCGQGLLPGQLRNSKCQHYLLAWQMSAAASPDGGGKPGCDDCGCRKKAVEQKDLSEEDQQNATDSDSASGNVKEQKKLMSGEWYFRHKSVPGDWYFKHKSVPAENKAQDCDENEFISEDTWDEQEIDRMQHFNRKHAKFHRFIHHSHVHRRRCRNHSKYDIYCYNWFRPMHKGMKWASVYYQNMMNFLENWQKQRI